MGLLDDVGLGGIGASASGINWLQLGIYFIQILYFTAIAGALGYAVWIFIRHKYRVHIWEIRNERLVYSKDLGREVKGKDGKIYFRLFWRKKLLPPINYSLVTSSTQKFFGKPIITLVQTNLEGYSGVRPIMTNEVTLIKEVNKLIDMRRQANNPEDSDDLKKQIENRVITLKNLSNRNINNQLDYDEDGELRASGYTQLNPESAIKTFALENIDLGVKNNYLTIGETIESYRTQTTWDKYGNMVINLAVFAFSMVMFIIVLQKTQQIVGGLNAVADALRLTLSQVDPSVVKPV